MKGSELKSSSLALRRAVWSWLKHQCALANKLGEWQFRV